MSDKFGRWRTMHLQNALYFLGSILMTTSTTVNTIYAARFVIGVAISFSVVADVPYLNEIAPSTYRGRLSSLFEIQVVLGGVLSSFFSLVFIGPLPCHCTQYVKIYETCTM